jgi:hypothetical protein
MSAYPDQELRAIEVHTPEGSDWSVALVTQYGKFGAARGTRMTSGSRKSFHVLARFDTEEEARRACNEEWKQIVATAKAQRVRP